MLLNGRYAYEDTLDIKILCLHFYNLSPKGRKKKRKKVILVSNRNILMMQDLISQQ